MLRSCVRSILAGLLAVLVLNASTYASQPQYDGFPSTDDPVMVRIPGHVLPALAKATVVALKPDADAQPITLTIVLKRDDEAGFQRYLRELYDPHSKYFRHFIAAREIARRFGPSRQSYDKMSAYLHTHGFKLAQGSRHDQTITVAGTRADAERAFGLKIGGYQIGKRKFYANQTDPALPTYLASHVQAVIGLSDLAQPRHGYEKKQAAALGGVGASVSIAFAIALTGGPLGLVAFSLILGVFFIGYALGGLVAHNHLALCRPAAAPLGTGQTVGLVEFDTFALSDVSNYLNLFADVLTMAGVPRRQHQ